MKKLMEKFERAMTAAAFAEEGEHETAREILREEERSELRAEQKRPRPVMRAAPPRK